MHLNCNWKVGDYFECTSSNHKKYLMRIMRVYQQNCDSQILYNAEFVTHDECIGLTDDQMNSSYIRPVSHDEVMRYLLEA